MLICVVLVPTSSPVKARMAVLAASMLLTSVRRWLVIDVPGVSVKVRCKPCPCVLVPRLRRVSALRICSNNDLL